MTSNTFRSLFRGATLAALPFLLMGCESPTDAPAPNPLPPQVQAIEIEVPTEGMRVGETFQLDAVVLGTDGTALDRPVTWGTSDTALAKVSAAGALEARRAGVVQVSAAAGGLTATASIRIRNGVPVTSSLQPASTVRGDSTLELTVKGAGFAPGAQVLWNGYARPTMVISATEIRATIAPELLAYPGAASVTVVNPGDGNGYVSGALVFTIEEPPVTWTTFALMGLDGERTLPVDVSRISWQDDAGVVHPAIQRVVAGTLRIRSQEGTPTQWDQTLTLAVVLEATGEEVRRDHMMFAGEVMYDVWDGSYMFHSYMLVLQIFRTRLLEDGGFVLFQALDTQAEAEQGWVYVQQ